MDRREFARLLAAGGAASLFTPSMSWAKERHEFWPTTVGFPNGMAAPDEKYWLTVRQQFLMPPDLGVMNAANLCPSSAPVLQAVYDASKDMDANPSSQNRGKLTAGRENTRKLIAESLRVTPEEIVITRNTSEASNTISSGLDLKAGDEVLIAHDNHQSNNNAWKDKAVRYGYKVIEVPTPNPHPGMEFYVDAFRKAITPNTKVIAITHLTSSVGDLFPAKELAALAHEHGIFFHLDGAQTFGLMDVDLSDIKPDSYSGSAHKWPCGPKETGVLFISQAAQTNTKMKLWPSITSAIAGSVGASRSFESYGQRDEPAQIAFGTAIEMRKTIGQAQIQARGAELVTALIEGLSKINGVKIWTSMDPKLRVAVLSFQPGDLAGAAVNNALYADVKISGAARGGTDRPGVRLSPHLFNTMAEVDRTVGAIKKYIASGLPAAPAAAARPG